MPAKANAKNEIAEEYRLYSGKVTNEVIKNANKGGMDDLLPEVIHAKEIASKYLEKKQEFLAISKAYLLNEDISKTAPQGFMKHAAIAGETLLHGFTPDVFTGKGKYTPDLSGRIANNAFSRVAQDKDIPMTQSQKDALEVSFGETITEGVFGLVPIAIQLGIYKNILGVGAEILRIPQLVTRLKASKSAWDKFSAFAIGATMEEMVTGAAGMEFGVGTGFFSAGEVMKRMNLRFKGKYGAIIQPFFDKIVQGGIGGTAGMELGEALKFTIDGLLNDDEWSAQLKHHFGDLSETGKRIASELIINGIFGLAHTKGRDYMVSPKRLRLLADELTSKGRHAEAKQVADKAAQIEGIENKPAIDAQISREGLATDVIKVEPSKIKVPTEKTKIPEMPPVVEAPTYEIEGKKVSKEEYEARVAEEEAKAKAVEVVA